MTLRLRFRRRWDDVWDATDAASARLPDDTPRPRLEGCYLVVPLHPDAVGVLGEELEARGLEFLARRLFDPFRWRTR